MGLNKRLIGAGAVGSGALTPSENFKVVTYTGNGGTQAITGVGFQPDFVWIKERSAAESHRLFDTTRGATKRLFSDNTNAESTATDSLTSFDTGGFTVGSSAAVNQDGQDYVGWAWKANEGTTSSNTDGTITSTVQANTDAGFSIVKYTGTGSAATVGHGLSQKPDFLIVKNRDSATGWKTWHEGLTPGGAYVVELQDTTGEYSNASPFNSTEPGSSVFTVANFSYSDTNATGADYIAYAFHSVEGFSKFGSYTGNGTTNGPIVETGFEPAFLMVKRTDTGDNWLIFDNKRSPSDPRNLALIPNSSSAEQTGNLGNGFSFLSNGFQAVSSDGGLNDNGGTYIYMAFAADPDTEAPTLADSFAVKTYTGTGSAQTISGLGFKPSFLWTKQTDGTFSHIIHDTLNQPNLLITNSINASITNGSNTATFTDDGFSLEGGGNHTSINNSGSNFVAWAWKADDNEPTINDNGSIDSLVSANANAGFSIIKWTGNATNSTVGHGLSSTPEFIIMKNLSAAGAWLTWHKDYGGGDKYMYLNSSNAVATQSQFFNSTVPTSTVFSLGTHGDINGNGNEIIAYCFHSISGYSKIGSYTGTGTTNSITGLGFQPDWLMIKRATGGSSNGWVICDSVRGVGVNLRADTNGAEADESAYTTSFDSDGFTLAQAGGNTNVSGSTYIYWAIKINLTPYPLAGNMSFLVIAGGGSGGRTNAGGAGAGGLRTSYGSTSGGGSSAESDITLAAGTYTITIGAGGAALTSNGVGNNGVDSSIAASGLTTITSVGGGGGFGSGSGAASAGSGGSGGGAGTNQSNAASGFGSGTANQGFDGGARFATVNTYAGGGGGGASAAGQASTGLETGGAGGAGLEVLITGSSVTYAGGGGGGGGYNGGAAGAAGAGGGTAGGYINDAVSDATANTGGGSGGTRNAVTAGSGGSGVVILRLLTSEYSSSVTGSPTVTTDGDFTIIKYTGSGTYVHS